MTPILSLYNSMHFLSRISHPLRSLIDVNMQVRTTAISDGSNHVRMVRRDKLGMKSSPSSLPWVIEQLEVFLLTVLYRCGLSGAIQRILVLENLILYTEGTLVPYRGLPRTVLLTALECKSPVDLKTRTCEFRRICQSMHDEPTVVVCRMCVCVCALNLSACTGTRYYYWRIHIGNHVSYP